MIVTKNNKGEVVGWREHYTSKDESVDVSVHGTVSTITTTDRNTGKVDVKTFVGKPLLPSDFSGK